jgi:two-component system sensor histidine kinase YesM
VNLAKGGNSLKVILEYLFFPYRYISRSLFRKIVLSIFLIVTLTVAALGVNYYQQTSAGIKQQAVMNMERLSEHSAYTLELYMSNIKNFAWNYFCDVNFQQFVMNMGSNPEAYSYYLSKFNEFTINNPMVNLIMVIQLDGNRIHASLTDENKLFRTEEARLREIAIRNDGKGEWGMTQT